MIVTGFYFLVSVFQICFLQAPSVFENNFTEHIAEQEKLSTHLDTIDFYLYRDNIKTEFALKQCQKIIDNGALLSDSILFEYAYSKI